MTADPARPILGTTMPIEVWKDATRRGAARRQPPARPAGPVPPARLEPVALQEWQMPRVPPELLKAHTAHLLVRSLRVMGVPIPTAVLLRKKSPARRFADWR